MTKNGKVNHPLTTCSTFSINTDHADAQLERGVNCVTSGYRDQSESSDNNNNKWRKIIASIALVSMIAIAVGIVCVVMLKQWQMTLIHYQ